SSECTSPLSHSSPAACRPSLCDLQNLATAMFEHRPSKDCSLSWSSKVSSRRPIVPHTTPPLSRRVLAIGINPLLAKLTPFCGLGGFFTGTLNTLVLSPHCRPQRCPYVSSS